MCLTCMQAVTSSAVVVWNPENDVVHACPISAVDRVPLIPKAKQILAIFEDTGLVSGVWGKGQAG